MLLNMARAEIKGGKKYPRIRGIVTFRQTGKGVLITAKIYNLPTTIGKCNKRMYARWFYKSTIGKFRRKNSLWNYKIEFVIKKNNSHLKFTFEQKLK